ncbi:hypothetical protein BGX28_004309, partial [Mortierella sp. GBA30]
METDALSAEPAETDVMTKSSTVSGTVDDALSGAVPGQRPQSMPKIAIPKQQQYAQSNPTTPTSPRDSPRHSHHQRPHQHCSGTRISPTQASVTTPRHSHYGRSRQVNPETSSPMRTPRRDSSLSQPLPDVLPALPPLIPVSSSTYPLSPSALKTASFKPASARATIPIDTSAARDLDYEQTQHNGAYFVSQGAISSPKSALGSTATPAPGYIREGLQHTDLAMQLVQEDQHQSGDHMQASATTDTTKLSPEAADSADQGQWAESPRKYLERIKETVSKAELGNLLSKGSDPFHQAVLRVHMESFDFRRDPIDLALRKFLLDFYFPKEAQQIDRVLEAFANRYHACNPQLFRSSEVVYTIAFSLMLLHTDAHNKNVRFKMSKEQYVRQARSIDGVSTIPADILEVLYDNITYLKFVYAEDELDVDGQRMTEVQSSTGSWFPRRRTTSNQRTDSYSMIRHGSIAQLTPDLSDLIPFRWPYYWKGTIEMVDNVQINNQFNSAPLAPIQGLCSKRYSQHMQMQGCSSAASGAEHQDIAPTDSRSNCAELKIVKHGILARKIDMEHGKKSAVRGWRDLGVILSGSQLLFFTDIGWFQQQRASLVGFDPRAPPDTVGYCVTDLGEGSLPIPQALISTLDSIAVVDSSYQKYPHVFRLVCPNGKQYLFRTESEYDMNDWMAKINYASAFKTAGVRLRNYHVAWAGDVFWIKDEQGRHQLRRRQQQKHQQQKAAPELVDGRAQLVQSKMKDIDRQITTCSASLASELRLARGLEVMIPLQNSTRQKIVQSAAVVGKRLRHLMLERTKLDCFRTILERDLGVVAAGQEDGLGLSLKGSLSGTTEFSPSSLSSKTVRTGWVADTQHSESEYMPGRFSKMAIPASVSMRDHLDNPKEEFVLESSRTSQSSSRSSKTVPRSRLNLPDFHRTVSDNALPDVRRMQPFRGSDAPLGPVAIQAAIIDAARGHLGPTQSTVSSPDPNHYQDSHLSLGLQGPQLASNPSLLSPDSPSVRASGRSRALSMPGQRPSMMPRTVSIYSSSSQTASRLRRMLEQGLGHLKWGRSSSSGGSSLRSETSFPVSDESIINTEDADCIPSRPTQVDLSSQNQAKERMNISQEEYVDVEGGQQGEALSITILPTESVPPGSSCSLQDQEQHHGGGTEDTASAAVEVLLPPLPLTERGRAQPTLDTTGDDSFVDDGEDEVAIHHEHHASTSLEQSFVMMVTTDYVTDDDDQQNEESEDETEAQDSHDGNSGELLPRMLTKDLNLSLQLDVPSLSILLD